MITFRPLTKRDRPLLEQAILADSFHKDWLQPWFFFHRSCLSVIGSDDRGPILILRMQPKDDTVHIFAQFVCWDRLRSSKAICEGFETVKKQTQLAGFKRIVMDSVSRSLVHLCLNRLGFKPLPEPNHYVLEMDTHEI